MYEVIKYFTDLQDNGHAYNVGDVFPRKGVEVKEARLKELASPNNKRGIPLIKEVVKNEKKVEKPQDEPKAEPQEEPTEEPKDEPKKKAAPKRTRKKNAD